MVVGTITSSTIQQTTTALSGTLDTLANRLISEQVTPLSPGTPVEAEILLHATGYRLPEGHRVLIKLSSAYWPILWPSPEPVKITLTPGLSQLSLPLRQAVADAPTPRALPAPDAPPRPPRGRCSPSPHTSPPWSFPPCPLAAPRLRRPALS